MISSGFGILLDPKWVVLEVPSLAGKVTLARGNRVAVYEEALKVGLKPPIPNVVVELL